MPEQEPPDDADPADVERDDELVEDLRAGQVPDRDALGPALAAWRDEVQRPVSAWIADPSMPSGWRWLPDLSVVEDTAALPVVGGGRVAYAGHVDYVKPVPGATFTQDDGSVYERPDPDEFGSFDDVDSASIVDDGAPD